MKEIDNWEALVKKSNQKYEIALPIPGCYISGEIDGENQIIETIYIDLSSLTVMDTLNEYYQLKEAKHSYLKMLEKYIEYSKQNKRDKEER